MASPMAVHAVWAEVEAVGSRGTWGMTLPRMFASVVLEVGLRAIVVVVTSWWLCLWS